MTSWIKCYCLAPRKSFGSCSVDHYCQPFLHTTVDLRDPDPHHPTKATRSFLLPCQEPFPAATNPNKVEPRTRTLGIQRESGDDGGREKDQVTPSRGTAWEKQHLTSLMMRATKGMISTLPAPHPKHLGPYLLTTQSPAFETIMLVPARTVRAIPQPRVLSYPMKPSPTTDLFKFVHPHISPTFLSVPCFPSPRHSYLSRAFLNIDIHVIMLRINYSFESYLLYLTPPCISAKDSQDLWQNPFSRHCRRLQGSFDM